jgi:hypothetical protein
MEQVRGLLGLQEGGHTALLAASVLIGGDYNADGVKGVGVKHALRMVAHLLQGRQVGGTGGCCWVACSGAAASASLNAWVLQSSVLRTRLVPCLPTCTKPAADARRLCVRLAHVVVW